MSLDLGPLLDGWNFIPGQVTVRQVTGNDGKLKLQLRLDLGLLQMELDGRPDGQRPFGHESLLEHYRSLAKEFTSSDPEAEFTLDAEDCAKLQQEAVQYYHRYLGLFQLADWKRVIRDTQRNLDLVAFVEEHAENESLAWMFQQFCPYIIMMRSRALAQEAIEKKNFDKAVAEAERGLEEIKSFFQSTDHAELIDLSPEVRFLENWIIELKTTKPLTERDRLQKALSAAIEREDYETAASIRDALRGLQ